MSLTAVVTARVPVEDARRFKQHVEGFGLNRSEAVAALISTIVGSDTADERQVDPMRSPETP